MHFEFRVYYLTGYEGHKVLRNSLATNKLVGKRVVLASNSPRRKEILNTLVNPCTFSYLSQVTLPSQGLNLETIPSTFDEDLDYGSFDSPYEYPVATATEKAMEVYERLVVSTLTS